MRSLLVHTIVLIKPHGGRVQVPGCGNILTWKTLCTRYNWPSSTVTVAHWLCPFKMFKNRTPRFLIVICTAFLRENNKKNDDTNYVSSKNINTIVSRTCMSVVRARRGRPVVCLVTSERLSSNFVANMFTKNIWWFRVILNAAKLHNNFRYRNP